MNTQITKNNLQIFLDKLESNTKLNDEWLAYKSFLSDGIKLIDLCVKELNHKDEVIRVNFKSDVIKMIDNKQLGLKLIEKEKEIVYLKNLIKEMEVKIEKVLNEF